MERVVWIGGASLFCAVMIACAIAIASDWARCSHPTSDFNRQTCGVGEHPTVLGLLGLALIVTLGVAIVVASVLLTAPAEEIKTGWYIPVRISPSAPIRRIGGSYQANDFGR